MTQKDKEVFFFQLLIPDEEEDDNNDIYDDFNGCSINPQLH